jgi:uncharacterized protein
VNNELQRLVDLIDHGRSDAAEAWARPRAEKGDADAQFLMGYLVFGEKRVDFRKACEWLHLAAAQDHPEALFDLSRVDESQDRANTGIPRSDAQRILLQRAANLGSVRAQADLARYCATGRGGFAKDQVEARAWCLRAAEGGDVGAQSMLGSMLLRGEGGPASTDDGLAWLERAAASDRSPGVMAAYQASGALEMLIRLLTGGIPGVTADPGRAAALKERLDDYRRRREEERGDEEWSVSTTPGAPRTKRPFRYTNPDEAKAVLRAFMEPFRRRPHSELVQLVKKDQTDRVRGPTGSEYEIKINSYWGDQPGGDVCVSGAINDSGWCACQDIYETFEVSPDGEIIGDSG